MINHKAIMEHLDKLQKSIESGLDELRDKVEPKQKYCCDWFEDHVKGGFIKSYKLDETLEWRLQVGKNDKITGYTVLIYCSRCGEELIKPINHRRKYV